MLDHNLRHILQTSGGFVKSMHSTKRVNVNNRRIVPEVKHSPCFYNIQVLTTNSHSPKESVDGEALSVYEIPEDIAIVGHFR